MSNIREIKKLLKMSDEIVYMRQKYNIECDIEDLWEQCFKAFPEKKTNEDNWYIDEFKMWDIIEDAIELLEETA